jgi:hypothetical protein
VEECVDSCHGYFSFYDETVNSIITRRGLTIRDSVLANGYEDIGAEDARFHPPQARKPLAELVHNERFGAA